MVKTTECIIGCFNGLISAEVLAGWKDGRVIIAFAQHFTLGKALGTYESGRLSAKVEASHRIFSTPGMMLEALRDLYQLLFFLFPPTHPSCNPLLSLSPSYRRPPRGRRCPIKMERAMKSATAPRRKREPQRRKVRFFFSSDHWHFFMLRSALLCNGSRGLCVTGL